MPKIIRSEFLGYFNRAQNSDKLFNVFLIEADDGTFSCVTEYGRRGNRLLRDTLCTKATRNAAEGKLRQKLSAKRNHCYTPYRDEPFGADYSQIAAEYGLSRPENNPTTAVATKVEPPQSESNVIDFPIERTKSQRKGIFNQGQFDSLEL